MLVRMKHFELHYVQSVTDAHSAENIGLIRFETDEFCEHCAEPVAFVEDGFEPCSVVLDDEYTYLLCSICALPVLNPGVEL
jgi:hypothetical protein